MEAKNALSKKVDPEYNTLDGMKKGIRRLKRELEQQANT